MTLHSSSTAVTNNSTVAGTPPTFSSAATNADGTKVVLTYNEALSATTAATSAFAVTTDGSANAVTAAAVSGSTVELTLTNTVKNDQTVTVAYTDPSNANDNNAVQDSQGNDVASLSSTAVTNNSTVAGTPPTFASAATSADGTKVVLTYNEALSATTAATSAFAVTTDGSANAVTAAAVSGSTVELTLTNTVKNDQTVTVAYTDPSNADDNNAVQDSQGNDVASLSSTAVTNNSTVAGTPPTFASAATNADGTKVVLTYNEALSATTAATSAFAVTTDGSANAVTAAAVSGSTVELTLTNTVKNDQTVTVAYTDPSNANDNNAVQDSQGNDVASLSSTAVTNNSTVAGTPPTFASSATSADGTKVVLTYNEALSATTAATSAFAVTTDGSANAVTAAAVSGSTVELTLTNTVKNDQTVTVAYTDPSNANDNNAVQDSQGNDVASLSSTAVTNNSTVAGTPPTFASAATNADGTKVVLTYNEALSATTAATSAFAVTTDGSANAVTAAAVSGSTVELTLIRPIASWQVATIAYTDPSNANDNNAVQDSQGNDVASLSSTVVTNNSTVEIVQFGSDIDGEATNDNSGSSVALSENGTILAIGATGNDGNGLDSGHTRIYFWNPNNNAWVQRGNDIDGEAAGDNSGSSIALSSDGNIIAIGAQQNDGNGLSSGHTRIYQWDSDTNTWVQRGSDIDGEAAGDESGNAVSFSSDGKSVAVGAWKNDGNGAESGHIRIYQWDSDNNSWIQRGSDINGEAAGDNSGFSVSLSADGNTVAYIGATGNDGNGLDSGHTRIYQWNSDNNSWIQRGSDINGEATGDESGYSVSLSADGNTVAIGATGNDGNGLDSGHTRIYQWNSDNNSWIQRGSDINGEATGDESGYSVSLSADSNTVAIGATGNDGNGNNSGHTRNYEWNGSDWTQFGSDIDGQAADYGSGRVSLSGNSGTVAIGTSGSNSNGVNAGHVGVYAVNDVTSPNFLSAATNADGTKVVLTYDEALSLTTASKTDFAVITDGAANTVTAVAVSGATVELTLTNAVKKSQVVSVAYNDPTDSNDNNAIQDSNGNDAASFSSTSATNNSTVASTSTSSSSAGTSALNIPTNREEIAKESNAAPQTWTFTNDFLEEQTGKDLDSNGVIGDGTNGNALAPSNLSKTTHKDGDIYHIEGTISSVAAIKEVQSYLSSYNNTQNISTGPENNYTYENLSDSSSNLRNADTNILSNVIGTLTISDPASSPASLSDLKSLKIALQEPILSIAESKVPAKN